MKCKINLNIFLIVFSFSFFIACKKVAPRIGTIYKGSDTLYYPNNPEVDYNINKVDLSFYKEDSLILYIRHSSFAPIDSPYSLHGGAMTYKGRLIGYSNNNIKVKWDIDLKEDAVCTETTSNKILFPKNRVTLIDISKDTLCIGNIECVKQK